MVEVAKNFLDPNSRKGMILIWDLFREIFRSRSKTLVARNKTVAAVSAQQNTQYRLYHSFHTLKKYPLLALEGAIKKAWDFEATL